jgi:hypothetical protein
MRPEISVHDNDVYAYSVDCEGQRLVLHTVFRGREPHEFTDVVFDGVVAHHFENVLPGNILFGVDDFEVAALVRDNAALLADSWRYGWPPVDYRGDVDVLSAKLAAESVRGFLISSSYGLCGWVLAARCEPVQRPEAAKVA